MTHARTIDLRPPESPARPKPATSPRRRQVGFNLTVATAFCFALAHDAMATSSPQRRQSERPTTPSYFSERGKGLLVLKVGTSSLMVSDATSQRLKLANVARIVEVIAELKRAGYWVVFITSGAVGMGCIKLGINKPTNLRTKQAVAAAGQSQLMRTYEDLFGAVGVQVAQLLISQNDFLDKTHWGNVKHTLFECLRLGLVPVINENDTTNTEELRFGDNDNLAALTAVQLGADALFLFTDVDYLYTANPRTDPDARALRLVAEAWALKVDTGVGAGSGLGTGGMSTKIVAARTATCAGIPTGMLNGAAPERVHGFLRYLRVAQRRAAAPPSAAVEPVDEPEGTLFCAMSVPPSRATDTRRWILALPVGGELALDDGAARALCGAKSQSLLPKGIRSVQGAFLRGEAVRLVHSSHGEIGRAVVNFPAEELAKICGRHSSEFEEVLGYSASVEACNRANIVITVGPGFAPLEPPPPPPDGAARAEI